MSDPKKVKHLYTSLPEALGELRRRRSDKGIMQKVASLFADLPSPTELGKEPRYIMSPSIVTPNLEVTHFLKICRRNNLPPTYFEYRKDKFVHKNLEKHYIGEMHFYRTKTLGIPESLPVRRLLDFSAAQGKPMDTLRTVNGESLHEYHHRIYRAYTGDTSSEIIDFSEWFAKSREFKKDFPYFRYLGLFIADAILFCNFTTGKYEGEFTEKYVLPAFAELEKELGLKPLVVPITLIDHDDQPIWQYYTEEVMECL